MNDLYEKLLAWVRRNVASHSQLHEALMFTFLLVSLGFRLVNRSKMSQAWQRQRVLAQGGNLQLCMLDCPSIDNVQQP